MSFRELGACGTSGHARRKGDENANQRRQAVPAWRDRGRERRELRSLFSERDAGRRLLLRYRRQARDRPARTSRATDEVFHGHVADVGPATFYGFRVHGPYEPEAGHRFNPNKLLLDPYARAHSGKLTWDPAVFGYTIGARETTALDERDSAPFVPKSVIVDPNFDWPANIGGEAFPGKAPSYTRRTSKASPICTRRSTRSSEAFTQVSVRSLSWITSSPSASRRSSLCRSILSSTTTTCSRRASGTIGAIARSAFLRRSRYASDVPNSLREFKEMIARLHDGGLEVILDVVYNHTAEGNERGPTLSFKGIDNKSYYRLMPDEPRFYINDTGTGNTVNLSHPRVIQMVADSLRYWATETRVDGFRFDLGTILAREPDGFKTESGFLKVVGQDPVLADVKLIAEPWDCPGGYQVGGFPPGWAEWNDRFRDDVRDFWRGHGDAKSLAPRLCASPDKFNFRGRRPWASVNFIVAHDGFTLNDVVSYNDKHNEANGEDNRDGNSDNRSWNCGAEGPTEDKAIQTLRWRQLRNLLATLILSQGTPMVCAGDEFGRTQDGNNNAYCQDDEISWIHWEMDEERLSLVTFFRRLTSAFHLYPVLRRSRFLTGEMNADLEVKDVTWIDPTGRR